MGRAKQKFTRVTAVDWVSRCIGLGRTRLAPWYPQLAGALLGDLADTDGELVRDLAKANTDLMLLVRATPRAELDAEEEEAPAPPGGGGEGAGEGAGAASAPLPPPGGARGSAISGLLRAVSASLRAADQLTRSAALRWLSMLLLQLPDAVVPETDALLSALLANLTDTADPDVLKLNLEVLARLAATDPSWALLRRRILVGLVALFGEQRGLLEAKAAFIVRRLCLLLDPSVVYLGLAEILLAEGNREFAALLVELLNLILLTSAELADFRDCLRGCAAAAAGGGGGGGAAVFSALFRAWVVNPVASISLCLLAHAYELAARLVVRVHDMQVTVGLLMQLDKLVQLLESPVFLDARLGLLRPRSGGAAALLTTLYGLLMILPQGTAYATLKDRLAAVGNLHVAQGLHAAAGGGGGGGAAAAAADAPPPPAQLAPIDVDAAEALFAESQAHFRAALSHEIRGRSVVGGAAAAAAAAGAAAEPPQVS
jgi:vacuole morphology and inheritance protein 14